VTICAANEEAIADQSMAHRIDHEHEEPTRGKESRIPRKKKRSYGAGCVLYRGKGLAIRWRENVIGTDGNIRTVLRCKALGKISLREANEELRKYLAAAVQPKQKPLTFAEAAASWKANMLPHYPKHSTRKHHADILDNKLTPFFGRCSSPISQVSTFNGSFLLWSNRVTLHIRFITTTRF